MAEKLTPQQEMAVYDRGGDLLISAAAGSGKTKVLVDRLLSFVMDPVQPAQLDEFLMITFTKAAASELRGKIASKLTEKMAEMPENRHLQRQMQRLYLTKITTVDAFCADLLREYAYALDIPADFRVADENECAQLRQSVMDRLLDEAYEAAQSDEDLRSFVDAQGLGRDDRLVPLILMQVYNAAQCHMDPDGWLDRCVQQARVEGTDDAAQTLWGAYLIEDLFAYLDLQLVAMENCVNAASQVDGLEKPAALLNSTLQQLRCLRQSSTWDEIIQRKSVDYGVLRIPPKFPDQELADRIKAVRENCKEGLKKRLERFADTSAVVLGDMAQTDASTRGIVALVRRFTDEYDRMKRARRVLDFGDLEHRTLDLLLGRHHSGPTAVARQVSKRYRQIMVDEYQDSNEVQDAIYRALSCGRNNLFMVGDVKQSIYRFRLADPNIFLEKYHTFTPAETAQSGQPRKILLSANFRSGGDVLKSSNDVFALTMSPRVGGLHYGEEEALKEGIPHVPLGEPEVELAMVQAEEAAYPEEAVWVAQRVCELLDGSHFVRSGDGLRPIKAEDIAILLRSPKSVSGYYIRALQARGIRCVTGGGDDLLQTPEVQTLRAVLQTVSNPRQDIPLIAALASPVFGFTADDLAAFRSTDRRCSVYDALSAWEDPKGRAFLQTLSVLRRQARTGTLAQLIEKIYMLTSMDSIFAAMDGGDARKSNLQSFYALAVNFESTARRDLEQFLEHLEALEGTGLAVSSDQSAAGAVTLMSIHKSKGLEFPVVFLCGLSREFNREASRAHVLCDQDLYIGLSYVDAAARVRYPTVAKRAITVKTVADSMSEEMRVLYVAMTRARDRLIMTYAAKKPESIIRDLAMRMDLSPTELLAGDAVCPGHWVLMAALHRTEAGTLFALGGRPGQTQPGDPVWDIRVVTAPQVGEESALTQQVDTLDPALFERIEAFRGFRYAHSAAIRAPSKQTATQRKGRFRDEEAAEDTCQKGMTRTWRKPGTAQVRRGKERGNAVHALMQHIRFAECTNEAGIERERYRLVQEGFLTPEQGRMIDLSQILAFFSSEVGKKLQKCQVLREFKFSILDDGEHYGPGLAGEQILLQGVVDCAILEEDGITILDFKTDFVTEETLVSRAAHYAPQIHAYADAMSRIFEKPVKTEWLYFFSMDRLVEMNG